MSVTTEEDWCEEHEESKMIALDKIADQYGIKHSTWCMDLLDFTKDHLYYGLKYVMSDNGSCCGPAGMIKVKGSRWIDIWKAIDILCKKKGCDHRFVEQLTLNGDTLMVSFGS